MQTLALKVILIKKHWEIYFVFPKVFNKLEMGSKHKKKSLTDLRKSNEDKDSTGKCCWRTQHLASLITQYLAGGIKQQLI